MHIHVRAPAVDTKFTNHVKTGTVRPELNNKEPIGLTFGTRGANIEEDQSTE